MAADLDWSDWPALPGPSSGHFAGMHNGALIVAGGSNFDVSPFQGGEKIWLDTVFVLANAGSDDAAWTAAGTLPTPRAYGGSIETDDGLLLIGGTDGAQCFDSVLRLSWADGALRVEEIAAWHLPAPVAFSSAARLGDTAYITGGQSAPDATSALASLWALDLNDDTRGWTTPAPLPGPARILPVVVAQDGALYVFSGAELFAQPDGKAGRNYLNDGYRFTPDDGWRAVQGPPKPVVAAPAAPLGLAHIIVASGDHGELVARNAELGDNHPGFPATVLAYHTTTDSWTELGEAPASYVTTQAVVFDGGVLIPGGEDRPGHRGSRVLVAKSASRTGGMGALDYAAIGLYFAALVAMGAYFSRREKSTEAFFLGGRKVPWWAVGISIYGTSLSAITYLSVPARAFASNWTWLLTNSAPLILAPLVAGWYIRAFRREEIGTAYEYLERRFNLPIRIYGSLCFMTFQMGRVGIVMLLPALALTAATGMDLYLSIAAMGLLATLYTMLGGIEAVIWTDVLQTIVLLFGAILALILIVTSVDGGAAGIYAEADAVGKLRLLDLRWDYTAAVLWVIVIGNCFSNLYPLTADQTIVQRYLSTADEQSARRAVWTNALLALPTSVLFFSVGTALWAFFREHPALLDPQLKNDALLPLFIVERFPAGVKGIIIAGIFAASMSSLDSSINSVASVLTTDYYKRFVSGVQEAQALRVARVIVVLFGVFGTVSALYVATLDNTSLWEPFLALLSFVGGGIAGIFALGVFTTRAHGGGAMVGAAASIFAVWFAKYHTDMHFFLHAAVGFIVAFVVGYASSLLLPGTARTGDST